MIFALVVGENADGDRQTLAIFGCLNVARTRIATRGEEIHAGQWDRLEVREHGEGLLGPPHSERAYQFHRTKRVYELTI